MTKLRKLLIVFICLFVLVNLSNGQIKTHQIGRLWQTMFDVGSIPGYAPLYSGMSYPGGDFFLSTRKNMERTGIWIGTTNWTDKFKQNKPFFVSEGGYLNAEAPDILVPISNKKKVRQRLPIVTVNGESDSRIMDNRSSSSRSTSLKSDELVETVWRTNVGVEVTRKTYAFANRRHDNYIIHEYIFKNSGNVDKSATVELRNQNLTGVYFGFWRTFIPSGDIGHEQMGGEHDEWCHYYGNNPSDNLRGLWYVYDGDNQRKTFDDTGDPSELTGELYAPQYPAFGVIHADTWHDDEADDTSQPATVNYWTEQQVHSHTKGDPELTLYSDLSSGVQSSGSDEAGYSDPWDPAIRRPQLLMSFGPYDIPYKKDVSIVIYEAVGSISRREAINKGRLWLNGELSDTEKNDLVKSGKDSLFAAARNAEWAWTNGVDAVPDGPESPSLNINAGPGKIELEWYYGNYGTHNVTPPSGDSDTDVFDFSGYRLYRTEESYLNEYQMIFECGGNSGIPVTNVYTDRDVARGVNYFYYVVAFDDGSQNTSDIYPGKSTESSHFSNRNNQFSGIPFQGARTKLDSIFVVPNPFHVQGLVYGGTIQEDFNIEPDIGAREEDRLSFVGLPAKAKIRIFTAHGDLAANLEHPDPYNSRSVAESADEMWFQITDSWQTIKSGVYFYHIEGWDVDDNYLGTATGKFVVIR
jgi:hypothetical protein